MRTPLNQVHAMGRCNPCSIIRGQDSTTFGCFNSCDMLPTPNGSGHLSASLIRNTSWLCHQVASSQMLCLRVLTTSVQVNLDMAVKGALTNMFCSEDPTKKSFLLILQATHAIHPDCSSGYTMSFMICSSRFLYRLSSQARHTSTTCTRAE